jgi:hypothetical protein
VLLAQQAQLEKLVSDYLAQQAQLVLLARLAPLVLAAAIMLRRIIRK